MMTVHSGALLGLVIVLFVITEARVDYASMQSCERLPKRMDTAWLTIATHDPQRRMPSLTVYAQIEACYNCSLLPIAQLRHDRDNCTVQLDARFPNQLQVREVSRHGEIRHWSSIVRPMQHSDYMLFIAQNGSDPNVLEFNFYPLHEAPDANIPIYVALGVLVGAALLWVLLGALCGRVGTDNVKQSLRNWATCTCASPEPGLLEYTESEGAASELQAPQHDPPAAPPRLRSLDTFRGLCLVVMVFVNYGGGGYWFFDHSFWNGLTLADLVFPWFTWIIGTAICISLKSQCRRGARKRQMTGKVVWRTAVLFGLGVLLESSNGAVSVDVHSLRIPGVLQRLAVSYATVALIEVHFAEDYVTNAYKAGRVAALRDVAPYWAEWVFMLGLVTLHLLLTFTLHVPGCPRGYIGPGGLAEEGAHENCTGGAAGYIDRWLFGHNHIYQTPTCQEVYKTTVPFDPEGALGTLTSIFMCFLGAQAGKILLLYDGWKSIVRRLLTWSFITGMSAGILCRFHQNEGWIPINKNLWSVSFVLGLAGMAFLLLTVFYLLCDVWPVWSGAPFFYPGMNSIAVYVAHLVFQHYFPVSWAVAQEHAPLLALHVWGVVFWTVMAALMYRQRVFIAI